MKTFQSWFFRILWWLTFVVIFLVIIVLLNRQWVAQELVERQIRVTTGLEPEMSGFSFGVLDPKVSFNNFMIYNTAEFGGTLFLDTPGLHIEYDREALRRREIHIKFMRVDLHEMDVVKNQAGVTNLMSFVNKMTPRTASGSRTFAPLNGYKFTGIDTLNLSIGTVKFVDLKNPQKNRSVAINLDNLVYTNVMSSADLHGLSGRLWLKGAYLVGLPVNPPPHNPMLQEITQKP